MNELLNEMVMARQISTGDAQTLWHEAQRTQTAPATVENETDILRWVAREYDVAFIDLEELEPEKQVVSLFPARVLLKQELLPIRRVDDAIQVAVGCLFAPEGLDALRTLTGLRLEPVLAPREAR